MSLTTEQAERLMLHPEEITNLEDAKYLVKVSVSGGVSLIGKLERAMAELNLAMDLIDVMMVKLQEYANPSQQKIEKAPSDPQAN